MKSSEASSTLGGNSGKYNATGPFTWAEANADNIGGIPASFGSSVSGIWLMGYGANSSSGSPFSVLELVVQSSNANALYAYYLQNESSGSNSNTFTVKNSTSNGLFYSYGSSANAFLNVTVLVGVKNNYVVTFLDLGQAIGESQLVSTIASDLS
jgi:hypothetical protein